VQDSSAVNPFAFASLLLALADIPAETQPDIAILATVRAKELRFSAVPNVTVTFADQARNATVWTTDRENLPDRVQPNVTYRDIGIRLTITSTLPNIEQILDEALGTSAQSPQP
jgi:hypothetical protein